MKIRKEFIVGIVSSIGIIGLVLGFFFLKGEVVWEEKDAYYAVFDKVEGLVPGNGVKINGYKVGSVSEVSLNSNDMSTAVVKFEITENEIKIPTGSVAKLEADLLGTGSINLICDFTTLENHNIGDTLSTEIQEDLQESVDRRLKPLMNKMEELISSADTAITIIESVFSNNTDNLNSTFDGLKEAIINFESVSVELDSFMTELSGNRYKITRLLTNVESITGNLKQSNDQITNMLTNFSELSDSLKEVDLIGIVNDAKTAINGVNLILDDIQNGDGTITKLMQDSTLYENMNLMVEEASRLVENIQEHPNRYLQFAVFGSKDKGINMSSKDEKILKRWVKDTLRDRMDD